MLGRSGANRSLLVVETQKAPSMHFANSIFASLLKPIDRRRFQAIVDEHDGDAYDKSFDSWDHLVTMIFAQLYHCQSLRGLELAFNANAHHHYHLNVRRVARSTLSDANARRPVGVFAGLFAMLVEQADRQTRREGAEVVRLIDASPIPLGKICDWATWNGRIRGMKMHVVYDPHADRPRCVEITAANVNDIVIGRQVELEAGATYVFDKAYCHFGWWKKINDAKAFFVTRAKTNARWRATEKRFVRKRIGDGFTVIDDAEVVLASKGDSRLPIPLRRIRVKRDNGKVLTLITNDLKQPAVDIAQLYKTRWQVELLFRWMKQHLDIRKFLGTNENAIRLQIIAAMIAYVLLRMAASLNRIAVPALRFAELVCQRLFWRAPIAHIDKPPPVNPSKRQPKASQGQLRFCYA
jgi:putative transposase